MEGEEVEEEELEEVGWGDLKRERRDLSDLHIFCFQMVVKEGGGLVFTFL